jgi:hypothetical protein
MQQEEFTRLVAEPIKLHQPVPKRDPAFANKTIYDLLRSDKPCITDHMSLNKNESTD